VTGARAGPGWRCWRWRCGLRSLPAFTPTERPRAGARPLAAAAGADPGNAWPAGPTRWRSGSGCSSTRGCRPTAAWPAPAATCRAGLCRRPRARAGARGAGPQRAVAVERRARSAGGLGRRRRQPVVAGAAPAEDPRELASRPATCAAAGRRCRPGLPLAPVFGAPPPADDERCWCRPPRRWAPSSAAWCRRHPFDRFRDALARGDEACRGALPGGGAARAAAVRRPRPLPPVPRRAAASATASLPTSAPASSCARAWSTPAATAASRRCRPAPQPAVAACRCARRGRHVKTRHVHLQHRNFGEFKVPSACATWRKPRPTCTTASLATLAGVVRHYSELTSTGCTPTASASSSRCS
jgi:hypothetical protein